MTTSDTILLLTATSTALIAGLFYGFSCAVNPGLGKLSDKGYLAAMQSINREIQNLLFLTSFMGTVLLLPLSTWLQYRAGAMYSFWTLLTATFIYAIGVFGLTMFGNVPLNQMLDKFNLSAASAEDMARQRERFEKPWNRLHRVRSIAVVASVIMVIIACLCKTNISG